MCEQWMVADDQLWVVLTDCFVLQEHQYHPKQQELEMYLMKPANSFVPLGHLRRRPELALECLERTQLETNFRKDDRYGGLNSFADLFGSTWS